MGGERRRGPGRRRAGENAEPWRLVRVRVPVSACEALEADVRDAGVAGAGLATVLADLAVRRARELGVGLTGDVDPRSI